MKFALTESERNLLQKILRRLAGERITPPGKIALLVNTHQDWSIGGYVDIEVGLK